VVEVLVLVGGVVVVLARGAVVVLLGATVVLDGWVVVLDGRGSVVVAGADDVVDELDPDVPLDPLPGGPEPMGALEVP
jgi:hypothetical protein